MPIVKYQGREINVVSGTNLKKALKKTGLSPYNSASRFLNCKGIGTCGTCAVSIKGKTSVKTSVEKWRLNFPPHNESDGLRLACQVKVLGDISVEKHNGFWGQNIEKTVQRNDSFIHIIQLVFDSLISFIENS